MLRKGKTVTYNESRPEDIPAQSEDSEGKDDPCCAVRHSVDGAEGQPHPALTRCHGVGHIHGRDRLDKEGDDQVGDGDVGEQKVEGALLKVVMVPDGADYHEVAEYSDKGQCHLQPN